MNGRTPLAATLLLAVASSACAHASPPTAPSAARSTPAGLAPASRPPSTSFDAVPSSVAPNQPGSSRASALPSNAPSPSPTPRVVPTTPAVPSPAPSPSPFADRPAHDPAKFGFAAKGMSGEVMAFVTQKQVEYAIETMDWDAVSTVAYFSLEATRDGRLAEDRAWRVWNSSAMDRLIETARRQGTKVVLSLERFSWSAGQTAVSRALLGERARRDRLARIVAEEVRRRGVDGVNVDFEPIPSGQRDEFTDFMRTLRRELDAVAPGLQLTYCVIGHHESYDVAASTGPDAADAVYLMGYHYQGTWSKQARSTAPMGGPTHHVADSAKSLLRHVEPHQLIVGVPYYGHAWPTKSDRLNAATRDGGFDVTLDRAVELAARHGARYDKVEQVAWVTWRGRSCTNCAIGWYQLYFDDARALQHKLTWIGDQGLLGTGVWTIGYEGQPGDHAAVMREALLGR